MVRGRWSWLRGDPACCCSSPLAGNPWPTPACPHGLPSVSGHAPHPVPPAPVASELFPHHLLLLQASWPIGGCRGGSPGFETPWNWPRGDGAGVHTQCLAFSHKACLTHGPAMRRGRGEQDALGPCLQLPPLIKLQSEWPLLPAALVPGSRRRCPAFALCAGALFAGRRAPQNLGGHSGPTGIVGNRGRRAEAHSHPGRAAVLIACVQGHPPCRREGSGPAEAGTQEAGHAGWSGPP